MWSCGAANEAVEMKVPEGCCCDEMAETTECPCFIPLCIQLCVNIDSVEYGIVQGLSRGILRVLALCLQDSRQVEG